MRKKLGLSILLPFFSFLGLTAEEGEKLEPAAPRPLFTKPAGLIDPGVLSLELGLQKIRNRDESTSRNLPSQLGVGINDWLDVRLGWGGPTLQKDNQGAVKEAHSDPNLGFQALFLKQKDVGFDLGVAYWHKFPVGKADNGVCTGKHDDTLLMTFSKTSGRWALDANAGANFLGRPQGGGRICQTSASVAVTYALAPGWNITVDNYYLAKTEMGPKAISSILAISKKINENLSIDLGFEVGHTRGAPRSSINLGIVWKIGKLW